MDCESRPRTNMITNVVIFLGIAVLSRAQDCNPSITTASGDYAPQKICSGQLIFDENFDKLDKKLWQPESTFNGGYVSNSRHKVFKIFIYCFYLLKIPNST